MEQYYINVQNSGPVAQWIEQLPSKQWVVGSIPPRTAKKIISQPILGWLYFFGSPVERGIGLPEQSSGSRHKVPRQFPARTAGADYRFSVGCIFLALRRNGELGCRSKAPALVTKFLVNSPPGLQEETTDFRLAVFFWQPGGTGNRVVAVAKPLKNKKSVQKYFLFICR